MIRFLSIFLVSLFPCLVFGQVPFPEFPQPIASFSLEEKDWSVEAPTTPKVGAPHAPTPMSIPGGRVIKTMELQSLLEKNKSL